MLKSLTKSQIDQLNVLRYASCIVVVVGHFFQAFLDRLFYDDSFKATKPFFNLLLDLPNLGVMIFFVLSGFLVTYSTFFDTQKLGCFSLKHYAKKRLYRIFPPLWFALTYAAIIFFIIHHFNLFGSESFILPGDVYWIRERALMPIREFFYNFFLIPGLTGGFNGALWSLSYECFYYLLFALALIFVAQRRWLVGIVLSTIVLMTIVGLIKINQAYLSIITVVFQLFSVWLMGVLVAYLFTHGFIKNHFSKLFLIVSIAIGVVVINFAQFFLTHYSLRNIVYGMMVTFFISYILATSLKPVSFLSGLFAKGSSFTYTLYLIHFPTWLFILSLIGYKLLIFAWYDYLALFILSFLVLNYMSFQIARILENRALIQRCVESITVTFQFRFQGNHRG